MTTSSNEGHQIAMIAALSVSSVLSVLGSSAVLWMASRNLGKIYNRQVCVLSIADMMFSFSLALQPWLMPASYDETVVPPTAVGSTASCTVVGFVAVHLQMTVAFCSCSLSLYFLIRVVYGWQDEYVARRLEIPATAFCILAPLAVGIPGLATRSYNPESISKITCTLDVYPPGCLDDGTGTGTTCIRGSWTTIGISYGAVLTLVCSCLLGCYGTWRVYKTVRDKFALTNRRSFHGVANQRISNRQSQVATQAILYSVGYFNCFIWPLVLSIVYQIWYAHASASSQNPTAREHNDFDSEAPDIFWLEMITAIFFPLQGFFNSIIFSRPNFQRWRSLHPEKSYLSILRLVLLADPPSQQRGGGGGGSGRRRGGGGGRRRGFGGGAAATATSAQDASNFFGVSITSPPAARPSFPRSIWTSSSNLLSSLHMTIFRSTGGEEAKESSGSDPSSAATSGGAPRREEDHHRRHYLSEEEGGGGVAVARGMSSSARHRLRHTEDDVSFSSIIGGAAETNDAEFNGSSTAMSSADGEEQRTVFVDDPSSSGGSS